MYMHIIRVCGYIENADYEKYKKTKHALKIFAEENGFSFMDVQYEEKNQVTVKLRSVKNSLSTT
jgi:hypothetical protein